jgi:hypothetical protein
MSRYHGGMLHARKPNWWTNSYDIMADHQLITRWNRSMWRNGGTFELQGRTYTIRANAWGTKYTMITGSDRVVASAERVGRKNWTVQAGGHTYEFQRTSVWRQEQALLKAGRPTGVIKRTSMWRSDAVAELPELDPAVQVFVFAVVLTMWDNAAAAAAAVSVP